MENIKEYIRCIEELNEELGVVGKNSYIYENTKEIEVGIEAPNHTISVTIIDKEALISEIDNNTWKDFIINEYLSALRYFDINTEIELLVYEESISVNDHFLSQKVFMIENDIDYFKEKLYVTRYIINN